MMNNPIVNGIYLTLRDLESRKRLEEQLINAQKMEAVGRLAGGIANDFNNIMTAVINYCEVLIKTNPDNDQLVHIVLKIINSAKEAANFTTQLLAFSSKQMFMPRILDIDDLLKELKYKLSRFIPDFVDFELITGSESYNINIDKAQLETVVTNILENAVDAVERIKDIIVKGKISIQSEYIYLGEEECKGRHDAYPGGFIRLTVTDNGCGIDPANFSLLFEPFFTTKKDDPSAGLGLPVAFGIVRQHGGWIELKSKPNEGSVFKVYLPVHSEKSDTESTNLRTEYKGTGERLLLIEDEENVRRLVVESLRNHGYKVFPAGDAGEAQKIYKKEKGKFDIVFTDIALPDKNGIDFINEVIKDQKTGVILTSGYFDEASTMKAFAHRNYRFIAKPYVLETLLKCIKDVLGVRK
jgi:two-component system, cell cycle sensor histidine kinase and response regulator CckA